MTPEQLLKKIKEIRAEYEEKRRNKAVDFNVFKILGVSGYELPMRDFLYELLRLEGAHRTGRIYLKKFFEKVLKFDIDNDELKEMRIKREHWEPVASDYRQRGELDLVLESRYRFIPIEVKIGTDEGSEQCSDYLSIAENKMRGKKETRKWGLFFLTMDGHQPGSVGDSKRAFIYPISWKEHIVPWLEGMLENEDRSNVKELIKQYIAAIEGYPNQVEEDEKMAVVNVLLDSLENFEGALSIQRSMDSMKEVIQERKNKFLKDVDAEVKKIMKMETGKEPVRTFCEDKNSLSYVWEGKKLDGEDIIVSLGTDAVGYGNYVSYWSKVRWGEERKAFLKAVRAVRSKRGETGQSEKEYLYFERCLLDNNDAPSFKEPNEALGKLLFDNDTWTDFVLTCARKITELLMLRPE